MNATAHVSGDAPETAPPLPDLATSLREARISLFLVRLGAAVLVALIAVTVGRLALLEPWQDASVEPPSPMVGEPAPEVPATPDAPGGGGSVALPVAGQEPSVLPDATPGQGTGAAGPLDDASRSGATGSPSPPLFGLSPTPPRDAAGGSSPRPALPRAPAMRQPPADPAFGARGRDG